jgi:hypothetical protein
MMPDLSETHEGLQHIMLQAFRVTGFNELLLS